MKTMSTVEVDREPVLIATGKVTLTGLLDLPLDANHVVAIANGLGRMRRPIAESFAMAFNNAGFATLMFNMLTPDELQFDSRTLHFSSDSEFQSERFLDVIHWINENPSTNGFGVAGVATGGAARGLLRAAGTARSSFCALIIDGGAHAADVPAGLSTPTLLIADDDPIKLKSARGVLDALHGEKLLEIIPEATISGPGEPFFSDPSARVAVDWLRSMVHG